MSGLLVHGPIGSERPAALWAAAAAFVVLVMAVLPPFAPPAVAEVLRGAFAFVCHQLPGRTPHVGGEPLAVCHRCLGIYLALPLGALALWGLRRRAGALRRHLPLWLGAALVVPGIDWALGVAGVWANTPASRVVTGAVFGFAAGLAVALSLARARARHAEA